MGKSLGVVGMDFPCTGKPCKNACFTKYKGAVVGGFTVYVVDDSIDAADSLVTLLIALGHQAQACYCAEELLALVETEAPDCVLLDIAMAGMDGLQLAQRLRAQFGDDVILVAITGAPPEDPVVQGTFGIVDHYFEKPVTLEQIRKLFPA